MRLGNLKRVGDVYAPLCLLYRLGTVAAARRFAARHLPVETAQIFEAMQPRLIDKWVGVGLPTSLRPLGVFVFVFAETSRDGIGQGPPVEGVPFRDQRDVAGLVPNFSQS